MEFEMPKSLEAEAEQAKADREALNILLGGAK